MMLSTAGAELSDPLREAVHRTVGEAFALLLPVALKLIDNHVDSRLSGSLPLFHGWGNRS